MFLLSEIIEDIKQKVQKKGGEPDQLYVINLAGCCNVANFVTKNDIYKPLKQRDTKFDKATESKQSIVSPNLPKQSLAKLRLIFKQS